MLSGSREELSPSVVAYIAVQDYNTIAVMQRVTETFFCRLKGNR